MIDRNVMCHVWQQRSAERTLKSRQDFDGRDIPVAPTLARLVGAHVARHGEGDLFTVKYRAFLAGFHKAASAAGLPDKFSPRPLRHGFASTLLSQGIALTDVARWMVDDPRTVASAYAHLMPGQADSARDLLGADCAGVAAESAVAA